MKVLLKQFERGFLRMPRKRVIMSGALLLLAIAGAGSVQADTITLKSDASTLAAALGPGVPSAAVVTQLDTGNIAGLTFSPVDVGSFGTFTPVPTGAPSGTKVVNIPPGDGENGFFEMTFNLPTGFTNIQLTGSANVDDRGRAFLNSNPISPSLLSNDPNRISEFGNATFSTQDASFFKAGENVILIADDNAGGGPSGGAFYATITFSPGVVSAVPEPSSLALAAMGALGIAGYYRLRRRIVAA